MNIALSLLLQVCWSTAVLQDKAPEDWPTWRKDPARSGKTSAALPDPLHLLWSKSLPPLQPAFRNPRLQFDRGYEPVVAGKTLYVGSSRNDSVTALETETGREKWRFFAEGPVRFAPVAWRDALFVASDDGRLYCLEAATGRPRWTFQAVPSGRKAIGNGRLISVWPVRGGPVVADDRVYFAAGVWPFEGIFVYALDAASGDVVWRNDRTGYLYGDQPHSTEALGGVTPQGYLVVAGDNLVVPCGTAFPATFDRKTGALKDFALPKEGRVPGGWFVLAEPDPNSPMRKIMKATLDRDVTRDRHEDRVWEGPGEPGLRTRVATSTRTFHFGEGLEGVSGKIHSMAVADRKLFVVTEEGTLSCFGAKPERPAAPPAEPAPLLRPGPVASDPDLRNRRGFALVWGIGDGSRLEQLALGTELQLAAVEPDAAKAGEMRTRLDRAGLYGTRATVHVGDPAGFEVPPYVATVLVCEDPVAAGLGKRDDFVKRLYAPLRPYGGAAVVALPAERRKAFEEQAASLPGARVRHDGARTWLVREGALAGATNYTKPWEENRDELVRAPLGLVWFDDALGHFKRSPQPVFVDGVMMSQVKNWRGSGRPYTLLAPVYSDVYTGRLLREDDPLLSGKTFPVLDASERQPEQYRPPAQKNAWDPAPPEAGERTNPLTGAREPRRFPKKYGCDGGVDYGHVFTMRSGTPAFYDKRVESGTIHVSGPRSGCTNSLIPANGLLNVPYFYEGCTCSYPLPVGLALVSFPGTHEQWATWGAGEAAGIRRVGINLGAPGDRMTDAGTLWLDVPSVGGPSPALSVAAEPEKPEFYYQHSVWVEGGQGWPWVAASGARGLRKLTLSGLRADVAFTVRLTFADPDHAEGGKRVFDIALQGKKVLERFDPVREGGGRMRAVTKEFARVASDGRLTVELTPQEGEPILSGVEVVAEGLALDPLPSLDVRDLRRYVPRPEKRGR
jgi:hypothetical protein